MSAPFVDAEFCARLTLAEAIDAQHLAGVTPVSVVLESKPAAPICPICHGLGMVDPTGEGPLKLCGCINGD